MGGFLAKPSIPNAQKTNSGVAVRVNAPSEVVVNSQAKPLPRAQNQPIAIPVGQEGGKRKGGKKTRKGSKKGSKKTRGTKKY